MDHFYQSRSLLCLLEKDGKSFKKSQKKKKENVKTAPRERERTKSDRHQSRFVTFQILEEDVSVSRTSSRSQIADRRSARVHPLTKKLSE